jgi:hypothetical protein
MMKNLTRKLHLIFQFSLGSLYNRTGHALIALTHMEEEAAVRGPSQHLATP